MRGVATPCTLGQVGQIQANWPLKCPVPQEAEASGEAQHTPPEHSCPHLLRGSYSVCQRIPETLAEGARGQGEAEKAEGAAETF